MRRDFLIFLLLILFSTGCQFNNNAKVRKVSEVDESTRMLLKVQALESEKTLLNEENRKLRQSQSERVAESGAYSVFNLLKSLESSLEKSNPADPRLGLLRAKLPLMEDMLRSKSYKEAEEWAGKFMTELLETPVAVSPVQPRGKETVKTPAIQSAGKNLLELRARLDEAGADRTLAGSRELETADLLYSQALDSARKGDSAGSENLAEQGIEILKRIRRSHASAHNLPEKRYTGKFIDAKPRLYGKEGSPAQPSQRFEANPPSLSPEVPSKSEPARGKVNINTANVDTLMKNLGTDRITAEGIIWYRENVNPFELVEELKLVPEITNEIYDKIYRWVKLKD